MFRKLLELLKIKQRTEIENTVTKLYHYKALFKDKQGHVKLVVDIGSKYSDISDVEYDNRKWFNNQNYISTISSDDRANIFTPAYMKDIHAIEIISVED